jgi:multiple sugar transport system substrate-binding protein
MRRSVVHIRRGLVTGVAALAVVAAGCGGGDDNASGGGPSGETLTVWNNEFQPDRMKATQAILAEFTRKTHIKTKLVAVPEDQLATLMTNAAAAGELPDVVLATPLDQSQQYAAEGIFDSDAAQAVVEKLGAKTFSQKALDLVTHDGKATGVPSDGWGQLLIYRKDLFDEAGLQTPKSLDDIMAAAKKLNGDGMAGITLATKPGDGFTSETFEHVALAAGCQLVDDSGKVTLDTPQCVNALRWYGDIAKNYSVAGAQDVDSTRGTYFAGRAAMMFWSPFLLDGMAGLRNDTKPSCKQCKQDPAFLAKNSGLVGPLVGVDGQPTQFGTVSTVNISVDAPTEDAQKLAEFMLSDGYVRWLALSPQGKYPVRFGDASDPKKFQTAWTGLESGVDRKAPLSDFYNEDSIQSLADGVENFQRWGFAQGQGALVGALRGEQPIATAVADVVGGKDPAQAAKELQSKVDEIQAGLQ